MEKEMVLNKEAVLEVLKSPEGKALIREIMMDGPRRHPGLSALQKRELLDRQYEYTKEMQAAEAKAAQDVWVRSIDLKNELASLDD